MANPTDLHWAAALKLVRYIKKITWSGHSLICYKSTHFTTVLRCWLDYLSHDLTFTFRILSQTRHSLISWKCKKQNPVARSSDEAEYRSMTNAVCEVTWLFNLLSKLHIKVPTPIPLYYGNTSALQIAENPILHERTKHIELDCHVGDKVLTGFISPTYLPIAIQPADIFTKPMTAARSTLLLS